METLLSKEETAKLYKKGGVANVRKLLEKIHKKEDLLIPESPLTEWKDIAKLYKMHPVNSLPYPKPKNERECRMNVLYKMDVMVEYYNTDQVTGKVWKPTKGDLGCRGWFIEKSGVGFVFYYSTFDLDFSTLGSRLHFKDIKTADFVTRSLTKLQNELFNF